jgi:putative addiction module component (TIGR02574 family)
MTRPAKEIVDAAIKLAERDRVQIVEELLASLEPDSDDDVDVAWAAEVERRSQEIKQGVVRPIPWAAVKAQGERRGRPGPLDFGPAQDSVSINGQTSRIRGNRRADRPARDCGSSNAVRAGILAK